MPIVSTAKMTARQFLQLGEDPPGVRLELVNGEIAVSASPLPPHSRVVVRLTSILDQHIEANDLGVLLTDCDTVFGEFDVRRPDLLFISRDREHLISEEDPIKWAPDLCVEVISKSTKAVDRVDKFKQYAKVGVKHYWIADPRARTLEAFKLVGKVYRPAGQGSGDQTVSFPPFPELDIPQARVWFKRHRRNNGR
jgi:Uma2 family endonuclease